MLADRVMQEVFSLDRGCIIFEVPARISAADFEDVKAWFVILERKLGRCVRRNDTPEIDYAI